MHLLFANIGWLALLSLVAMPIIAHLVAKRRPKVREFPSLIFLKRVMKKSARYRKPQDWILLALRSLAVLALVTAFLHPLLTNLASSEALGNKSTVVLVVDVSASMAASGSEGRRMDIAVEQAIGLLENLKPSRANVILVGAQAEAIFPEPGPNLEFLISKLKEVAVRPEPGAIRSSLRLAADQLSAVEGDKEIFILSDFQATAWQDQSLPGGVPVKTIRCGEQAPPNVAITDLVLTPADPVIGEEVQIQCRLSNFSNEARSVPVVIEVGGRHEAQDINLEPNGQGQAVLKTTIQRPGMVAVRAELAGDSFIADNVRHAVLPVKPARKLLLVLPTKASRVPVPLSGVARALPWLELSVSSIDELHIEQAENTDYLFVLDWDGRRENLLKQFAEAGISTIVAPANKLDGVSLKELFAEVTGRTVLDKAGEKPWTVECLNLDSSMYKLFRSGQFGSPLEGEVSERIEFPQSWLSVDGVECWAKYSDGSPALLARDGADMTVMLWNLPLEAEQSTLTAQPNFVVFFGELLRSHQPRSELRRLEALPGFPIRWEVPEEIDTSGVHLIFSEDGSELEIKVDNGEAVSEANARPGRYQWTISGQPIEQMVVNFPSGESDLAMMADDNLEGGEMLAAAEVDRFIALREGRPLWPWCLALALLCLVLESLIAAAKPNKVKTQKSPELVRS